MAGFSLLALLDDIGAVLDDVAVLSKTAAKKTAGIIGDDLALTARQVFGLRASRELPVVFKVAGGSLRNKLILAPLALVVGAVAPFLITPLLTVGGCWLCAEGAEKVVGKFFSARGRGPLREISAGASDAAAPPGKEREKASPDRDAPARECPAPPELDPARADLPADLEKKRIAGAVRTDFVLSAEIIVITLGSLPPGASLFSKAAILAVVGLVMTFVVYGFVACIVKLDDLGFWLCGGSAPGSLARKAGRLLVGAAPWLMRGLSVVGAAAMFMVGGGIVAHLPFFRPLREAVGFGPVFDTVLGFFVGALLFPVVGRLGRLFRGLGKKKAVGGRGARG
ncbi:MAG: DUF808 domain-containing protein, partial [Deltaproteobacteria bacterium]|nr:DUF808 domain-containing protein [Deltaproteobacteria bacterium]